MKKDALPQLLNTVSCSSFSFLITVRALCIQYVLEDTRWNVLKIFDGCVSKQTLYTHSKCLDVFCCCCCCWKNGKEQLTSNLRRKLKKGKWRPQILVNLFLLIVQPNGVPLYLHGDHLRWWKHNVRFCAFWYWRNIKLIKYNYNRFSTIKHIITYVRCYKIAIFFIANSFEYQSSLDYGLL